jgi:hypothetical protein
MLSRVGSAAMMQQKLNTCVGVLRLPVQQHARNT